MFEGNALLSLIDRLRAVFVGRAEIIGAGGQIVSTLATGTAPLSVASTTRVANLNADLLDNAGASTTPAAGVIPIADGTGKIAAGWYVASAPGIFAGTADAVVANTNAETTMMPTGSGSLTLAANFWTVGKTVRVKLSGKAMAAAGGGTLRVRPKIGTVVMLDSAAVTTPTGVTGVPWEIEVTLTCRTTGATGTIQATGRFGLSSAATGVAMSFNLFPSSAVATVDTTASAALGCTALWDTNTASRTITTQNCVVEALN